MVVRETAPSFLVFRLGFTWFHNGEGADEIGSVRLVFINLPGRFTFINLAEIEIGQRTALLADAIFDMAAEGICLGGGKGIEILEQDVFLNEVIKEQAEAVKGLDISIINKLKERNNKLFHDLFVS